MAQDAARTWKDYGKLTRVEETVLYARLRGFKTLGIGFYVGLPQEAEMLTNLLLNEGFEVASACCMCGALCSEAPEEPFYAARSARLFLSHRRVDSWASRTSSPERPPGR